MVNGVAVSSGSLITTPFLLIAALGAVIIITVAAVTTSVISLVVVTNSITSLSSVDSGSSSYILKTLSACSRAIQVSNKVLRSSMEMVVGCEGCGCYGGNDGGEIGDGGEVGATCDVEGSSCGGGG
nr:hypothetical protein [Tanacetum cinerariifolium]